MVLKQRPNVLSYLRTHILFQLSFGLLSMLPQLDTVVFRLFLTQIRVVVRAKVVRVNSILMTLSERNY